MTFLEKLKIDRQDLIDSLCENIASLEKIAFEQQAEIERLQREIDFRQVFVGARGSGKSSPIVRALRDLDCARTEAIKEFAERLKKSDDFYDCIRAYGNVSKADKLVDVIDNLVKEMVGE